MLLEGRLLSTRAGESSTAFLWFSCCVLDPVLDSQIAVFPLVCITSVWQLTSWELEHGWFDTYWLPCVKHVSPGCFSCYDSWSGALTFLAHTFALVQSDTISTGPRESHHQSQWHNFGWSDESRIVAKRLCTRIAVLGMGIGIVYSVAWLMWVASKCGKLATVAKNSADVHMPMMIAFFVGSFLLFCLSTSWNSHA